MMMMMMMMITCYIKIIKTLKNAKQYANKKLGYRRDSARLRSLCRSWSFEVSNFDISRKPVCDFILTTYILFRTVFQLSRSVC